MNFSKIKNFIKRNGDRVLIVENGEPEMVLMSFEEYEKMAGAGAPAPASGASAPSGQGMMSSFSDEFDFFKDTGAYRGVSEGAAASSDINVSPRSPEPHPGPFVGYESPQEAHGSEVAAMSGESPFISRRAEELRLEDLPL